MLNVLKLKNGFAMVLTMVAMLVVTVLGITLWQVGASNVMQVERDENSAQAYYYARSGVEAAVGLIIKNIIDSGDYQPPGEYLYGKLGDGAFLNQSTDDYNIKFLITRVKNDEDINKDIFNIQSTGVVRQGGAEGTQAAANDLGFVITLENLKKAIEGNDDNNSGDGTALALFSNNGITFSGSAGISGNVMTNTVAPNTVIFNNDQVYIKDGDLYLGPNADKTKVIEYFGGGAEKKNIPDGYVLNLQSIRSFPLPVFPDYPVDLPSKGTLATATGKISGRVCDANGKGVGGVTIYIGPSIPGNLAKTSITTIDNPDWVAGHGTWEASPGDKQEGTVIVTPVKAGYEFNPQFIKVTGPKNGIDFVAIPNANMNLSIPIDQTLKWGWEIIEDGYYDKISLTSDKKVYIDLQGGMRKIRVGNLDIQQGSIELVNKVMNGNNGKLIFYVGNAFTLTGSSKVNDGGNINDMVMYYKGSNAISAAGATKFVGSVVVEKAEVTGGGCVGFIGDIISLGNKVSYLEWTNNEPYSRIIYAPNAYLDMSNGSGKTKGTVIVKKCDLGGGGDRNTPRIIFNSDPDLTFFNSLNWGPEGPPSLLTNEATQTGSVNNDWRVSGQWKN
ncbi:hypothetical protein [Desulfoscipio gibsoniae]